MKKLINCKATCPFCNKKAVSYTIKSGSFSYFCTKCNRPIDYKQYEGLKNKLNDFLNPTI